MARLSGKGWAGFGEVYYEVTDRIKLTAGLRYNHDEKEVKDNSLLWNARDANFPQSTPVGGNTLDKLFTRLYTFVRGGAPTASELQLINYYGQGGQLAAALATPARSPQRLAISDAVPLVPDFNEQRNLTNSPHDFDWDETTGRIGVDWQVTDDSMVYLFYSRGYKPGGANPPIPPQFQADSRFEFDPEFIDAVELGMKNTLMDGTMTLNVSVFGYNYDGLQVARIKNNTSLNENIDADILGVELETSWRPESLPNLQVDAFYSYLKTEANGRSVDPTNRDGGDPNFIVLNDFAFLYAAERADITPALIATATALGATFPAAGVYPNGTPGVPDGTPVVMSRAALTALGATTVEGIPVTLDGNQLPNSPENTVHLGVQYTFPISAIQGDVIVRWDYSWRDDSYAREFNTVGDEIDGWDQQNASIVYASTSGVWEARAWIRNIEDEENVTGHYLTSDTSGYYRNYFLTEPRIYGASVRYNFGAH